MRRLVFLSLCCAVALLLAASAQAETWSTEYGDFTTKFWKEMFEGGGPGQPGNVLMALGDGFHFKQATLESTYYDEIEERWITTYVDGDLLLNSQGPWLDRKKLHASGITATNSSAFDPETGELDFVLTFEGEFDNAPGATFEVRAWYHGVPEFHYDGEIVVFQRGYDFGAEITIDGYE